MASTISVAPPYSVVLVEDAVGGDIPEVMGRATIKATDSCIAIACLAEIDGETEITLADAKSVDPGSAPAFDEQLRTPSRKIIVRSVEGTTFLELPVPTAVTRVRVWVNDSQEPDRVLIGVG
jgi:hypothetical protein